MATEVQTQQDIIDAMEWHAGDDGQEWMNRSDKKFRELFEISDNLPDGEIVGAMLSWPRADGKAFYQVVSAKPLRVQHIPYGDGWSVESALIRGLRHEDIQKQLRQNRAFNELFGKQNKSFAEAQAEHQAKQEV